MNTKAETAKEMLSSKEHKVHEIKFKRFFDVSASISIILMIWPLMLCIALAIKLNSPGPVFFKQRRRGKHLKEFEIYKFRSMKVHIENGNVTQAKKNDPRVTAVGKIIRKTSLDELPQFINVLLGDMSIVGPRPHAIEHDRYYEKLIPHYNDRYLVKPGITGLAQISGFRGETSTLNEMEQRIVKDIEYVQRCSFIEDLKIFLMTPIMLMRGNNY